MAVAVGVNVAVAVGVGVRVDVGVGLGTVGVGVGVNVAVAVGVGVGAEDPGTTLMAEKFALSTLAGATMLSTPSVTVTTNVRCTAANCPATAQISKFWRTVCPSMLTLNTRCPGALKYISAK